MASVCIHPTEVLHVLKTLKCSTSATFDGIPQIIYKKCAISLYKPLAMIFNASLLFNEVPSLWKESIVTAIPKSRDHTGDTVQPQHLPSYSDRLKIFKLKTLLYRRVFNDLVFCFKVLKGVLRIRPSKYWVFRPCRGRVRLLSLQYVRIHRCFQTQTLNSLFFRGAKWLQMLPFNIMEYNYDMPLHMNFYFDI
ncbi:hypothetical protein OSTOST_11146 [Ostertagia ostertagi]